MSEHVESVTEDAAPTEIRRAAPSDLAMAKLQAEYAHMCASAGEAAYQIAIYTERLKDLTTKMRKLNVKAAKLAGKQPATEN